MADITEEQVFEAFGLEQSVNGQEVADPAPAEGQEDNGENGQGIAAPADREEAGAPPASDADTADPEGTDGQAGEDGPVKPEQSKEQRRVNAARRRQEEEARRQAQLEQAVAAAREEERRAYDQQMKDFFQQAGLKNTVTGEAINDMEGFRNWRKQFAEARLQKDLKAGKLTPEALAEAIGNHPAVQQAQRLMEQDAARQKAQEEAQARQRIDAEIAEIHELDASISSLEDLAKAPYWPELYAMTRRGYSIKDAHFLLNHKKIEAAKAEAARQQAAVNARGKGHMVPTTGARGGGAVTVPREDMAMFRAFMPDATDAEIQAYYNKNKEG